jgi:hypothetical protein
MRVGSFLNISNEEYHGNKDYLSRSSLKDYDRNPYYYWAMHLNPDRPERKATPQMDFGSAFHLFICEPEKFDLECAVEPEKKVLKYDGEEEYRAYKLECEELARSGKLILSSAEFETLKEMKAALTRDSRIEGLIEGAEVEKSFFWQDKETGLYLKSRPDLLHTNMIVDVKTCADASPRAFSAAIADYWYHVQAAMVQDAVLATEGRMIESFIFVGCEKKYPFNTCVYLLEEDSIKKGREKYKEILPLLKHSLEHNDWPDFEIQSIGLPGWYR